MIVSFLFFDDDLMLFYLSRCHYTVGNKDDNPERKVVEKEDAMKFAEQMGIQVFETSAKDNKNVEEVCGNLVNLLSHCTRILLEQIIIQPI